MVYELWPHRHLVFTWGPVLLVVLALAWGALRWRSARQRRVPRGVLAEERAVDAEALLRARAHRLPVSQDTQRLILRRLLDRVEARRGPVPPLPPPGRDRAGRTEHLRAVAGRAIRVDAEVRGQLVPGRLVLLPEGGQLSFAPAASERRITPEAGASVRFTYDTPEGRMAFIAEVVRTSPRGWAIEPPTAIRPDREGAGPLEPAIATSGHDSLLTFLWEHEHRDVLLPVRSVNGLTLTVDPPPGTDLPERMRGWLFVDGRRYLGLSVRRTARDEGAERLEALVDPKGRWALEQLADALQASL